MPDRVVYFDQESNRWASTDGTPVCQDHATPEPCEFHAAAETCPAEEPSDYTLMPQGHQPDEHGECTACGDVVGRRRAC